MLFQHTCWNDDFVVCTNNAVPNSLIVITYDLAQNMFWNQEFYKQRPAKQPLKIKTLYNFYYWKINTLHRTFIIKILQINYKLNNTLWELILILYNIKFIVNNIS